MDKNALYKNKIQKLFRKKKCSCSSTWLNDHPSEDVTNATDKSQERPYGFFKGISLNSHQPRPACQMA